LPQLLRPLPELEFRALIVVMRALDVFHSNVADKPYCFRFTGPPYNSFLEDCRSIQVMAHNKGSLISPLNLASILTKFGIPEERFFEVLDRTDLKNIPNLPADDGLIVPPSYGPN
jgi:hypothetical protein